MPEQRPDPRYPRSGGGGGQRSRPPGHTAQGIADTAGQTGDVGEVFQRGTGVMSKADPAARQTAKTFGRVFAPLGAATSVVDGVAGASADYQRGRPADEAIVKNAGRVGVKTAGGLAGARVGAALGAAGGTAIAPGVGTIIGGGVGGIAGYFGGQAAVEPLAELVDPAYLALKRGLAKAANSGKRAYSQATLDAQQKLREMEAVIYRRYVNQQSGKQRYW